MNIFTKTTTIALATILFSTSLATAGGWPGLGDIGSGSDSNHDSMPEIFGDIGAANDHVGDLFERVNEDRSEGLKPEIKIIPGTLNGFNDDPKLPVLQLLDNPKEVARAEKSGHLVLDCSLGGADLLIANAGSIDVPAGTKLKWSVKSYGAQGYVQLRQGLEVGADVRVAAVLDGAAQDGTRCAVKVSGL